ncbi:pentapeptide repeat-containing protein [Rothia sp. P13129]|uniref:pentapeptide repeat-containing protein n=1 Tax=Rothia sp. P13129 TaxID=3402664 RepID=UPI003ACFACEE
MVEKIRKTIKEKYENFKENPVLWIKKAFSKIKLSYIFYAFLSSISGILIGGIWVFSSRGGENQKPWSDWQFWFSDIRIICLGVIGCTLQLFFIRQKEKLNYIGKIIYYIVPLFTFIISIGIWTLIWSKYDGTWSNIQQGIITVFAGLIGAIGVFVTVAVNYENHEQNRNIQSEIERKRRKAEQKIENARRDNETIKDLNECLHEILKNRHSTDENVRTSSYFQLAGLYKDWGLLGKNSVIIEAQRKVQQKNILKLIFGTAPDENAETKKCAQKNSAQVQSSFLPKKVKEHAKRSFLEIRTLNSVIADIFPKVSDTDEYKESFEPFDLQYADLSGLNFKSVFFPVGSNLSHADLTGAELQDAHLQGAKLRGAHLQDAELQSAKLRGAHLQGANLQNAELQGAELQGAKLQRTNLQNAELQGTNLQNAELQGAHLQGAHLQGAHLQGANLQRAELQGANLQDVHLQGRNLQRAELQDANLQGRNLQDANLQDAELQGAHLQGAHLQGAHLQGANLQRANLQNANLQNANLQNANLQEANLWSADLWFAHLQGAYLQNAYLQDAYLQDAYLQDANLQDAHLEDAHLEDAHLQRAYLQDAHLQDAHLEDAHLEDAHLQRAYLQDANLQDANLQNAHLQDANLRGAKLFGADLQNARLYKVKELTAEQLAKAQNIESIQTRDWQFGPSDHSKEDQDLKNLIQKALKIQKDIEE